MTHQTITRALLAAGAALSATAPIERAAAVTLNPQGTGQVLLFPFYTVNGQNQTLISIANTTARAKAIAVHFREARNGRPVGNLNVYLAPFDTWTGAITQSLNGAGARLVVRDRSCTVPAIAGAQSDGVDFNSSGYTGANRDYPASTESQLGVIGRTREGFVEVIEMGELQSGPGRLQFAEEVVTRTEGVPLDCHSIVDAWVATSAGAANPNWSDKPALNIDLPGGGLRGNAAIVNALMGTMFAYSAEALTGFYADRTAPGALHQLNPYGPTLANANSGNGQVIATLLSAQGNATTEIYTLPQPNADPVSLVLMQSRVLNEFVTDPALGASNEWVLTFPTKSFYVDSQTSTTPLRPFTSRFSDDGRADEKLLARAHDRGGRPYYFGDQGPCLDLATCKPPPLPNSVNVLAITQASLTTDSDIFGAAIGGVASNFVLEPYIEFAPDSVPVEPAGTLLIGFGDPSTVTAGDVTQSANYMIGPSGRRYFGLPVIGLSFTRYINRNVLPAAIANYAGENRHSGELVTIPELP